MHDVNCFKSKILAVLERLRVDKNIEYGAHDEITTRMIANLSGISYSQIKAHNLITPDIQLEIDLLSAKRKSEVFIAQLNFQMDLLLNNQTTAITRNNNKNLLNRLEGAKKKWQKINFTSPELEAVLKRHNDLYNSPYTLENTENGVLQIKPYARTETLLKKIKSTNEEGYRLELQKHIMDALNEMRADTSVKRTTHWKPSLRLLSRLTHINIRLFTSLQLIDQKIEHQMEIVGVERRTRYLVHELNELPDVIMDKSSTNPVYAKYHYLKVSADEVRADLIRLGLSHDLLDQALARFKTKKKSLPDFTKFQKPNLHQQEANLNDVRFDDDDIHSKNMHLLSIALKRMVVGENLHTPTDSRISLQSLCAEAQIEVGILYRFQTVYAEVLQECRKMEMERKLFLLNKTMDDVEKNLDSYAKHKSTRISLKLLFTKASMTKEQVKSITLPMTDIVNRIELANKKLRKIRAQNKKNPPLDIRKSA